MKLDDQVVDGIVFLSVQPMRHSWSSFRHDLQEFQEGVECQTAYATL